MHPPDHSSRTPRRRVIVAALLLLGGWAVFQLVEETGRRSGHSSRPGPNTNGVLAPNAASDSTSPLTHALFAPTRAVTVALALPLQEQPFLRFNGRRFEFNPDAPAALAERQRRLGEGSNLVALVGLTAKPGQRIKSELAARGVELLDYVPANGWIARVHGAREPAPEPRLFCFQPLDAALRTSAGLKELALLRSEVPVYVHAVRDRPVAGLLDTLASGGFERWTAVSVGDRKCLAGSVDATRLTEFLRRVASHPDALWIEPGRGARLLNARATRTAQSGTYNGPTPFFDRGIFGADQVIAICDTGLDVDSCFFRDSEGQLPPANGIDGLNVDWTTRKVIAADFLDPGDDPGNPLAWDNHGHGTAVAGTAAGSSLYAPRDPQADNGMAPAARLIIQDAGYRGLEECGELPGLGCPVTNFYPALLQAVAQGATIHNNSWGDLDAVLPQNIYSQTCRELDLATWSNKQFLVVCAAGNNYFSDTVGSPSTAKNGLSVAASLSGSSAGRVASFSSRGWAGDGRFKPDVTAPGQSLRTAANDGDITTENCYRTTQSGTSFAAPVVSGLAALVRDYFAQGFYPTGDPVVANQWPGVSAALVKAILINAAMPMSEAAGPPPSRDQGWGRINLSRTLRLTSAAPALLALDQSPGFAESPAFPFRVCLRLVATNHPVKINLVWSDYPATPGADLHLVNDLDLRVRTPSLVLKGNQLIDAQSVPGGNYDRLNNVEQVEWSPGAAELVEISVWAHRIVVGPQDFGLVVTGDFEVISQEQDVDNDGLSDFWERWHFGGLAPLPEDDTDGDGASHAAEFAANTDPANAGSVARLEIVSMKMSEVSLGMKISEGRQYVLERSAGGLAQGTWSAASESLLIGDPLGETTVLFTDTSLSQETGSGPWFYRVRIDASP